MKICSRCHQQKEEVEFQIRRASRDGLTAVCRVCLVEYDKERASDFATSSISKENINHRNAGRER